MSSDKYCIVYDESESLDNLVPLFVLPVSGFENFYRMLSEDQRQIFSLDHFDIKSGSVAYIKSLDKSKDLAVALLDDQCEEDFTNVALELPKLNYKIITKHQYNNYNLCLAWGMAAYTFDKYKKITVSMGVIHVSDLLSDYDYKKLTAVLDSQYLVKDLINTPACDMGVEDFISSAKVIANEYKATLEVIKGSDLEKNYPAVYAVGKGAFQPPAFLKMSWNPNSTYKVNLVGKGIVYDTGGLNLKLSNGMKFMKKDMGGAAHALGLAKLIMQTNLDVNLNVLIPLAENSIGPRAMRQGDVINTAKGITVEVNNTDAEGRLVLADALFYASLDEPDLIIDFATLTGAARVALGPDVAPMFTNDVEAAKEVESFGNIYNDPVHIMPLWKPYNRYLKSNVAELSNVSDSGYAGTILAALFLEHFVGKHSLWMHFDVFGWHNELKAKVKSGANVSALMSVFAYIENKAYLNSKKN